jgi:polyphosphate glucokinase
VKATARRHILCIDIGGSHVKLRASNRHEVREFCSGPSLTARQMTKRVLEETRDWTFHDVSIGFPGVVVDGRIVCEPANLGGGWIGFDFAKAIGRPTLIMNDAVMQALGGYAGGRMLFLGFGTGLGAVFMMKAGVFPMELAHLPFSKRGLIQHYVGDDARRRLGVARWRANARQVIRQLREILDAQYVIVGGGNAKRLGRLPKYVCLGDNRHAFIGGFRAWGRRKRTPRDLRP